MFPSFYSPTPGSTSVPPILPTNPSWGIRCGEEALDPQHWDKRALWGVIGFVAPILAKYPPNVERRLSQTGTIRLGTCALFMTTQAVSLNKGLFGTSGRTHCRPLLLKLLVAWLSYGFNFS